MARSTVSRALRPGGALFEALLPGGRVNAAHPVVVAWLGEDDEALPDVLVHETGLTISEVAEQTGRPVTEIRRELEPGGALVAARVPPGHIAATEFAARAEVPVRVVVAAARDGDLTAALLSDGRLDLGHPAALAFMAAHPFRRGKDGDPICPVIDGDGFLVPALVGEDIDMSHPVARAWCARLDGRVPTSDAA